jgi:outer membrane immunogenic protein
MRRSTLFILALLGAGLSGAEAEAAEPAVNWSGLYLGANGGYAWSDGDESTLKVFTPAGAVIPTFAPLRYSLEPEGPFGGGQIGFNHQTGELVLGVEADIQASDIDDDSFTVFANPGNPNNIAPFAYDASLKIDWFGTVRARLGYAWDRSLVYVTGGLAYGQVDYRALYDFLPVGPGQSFGRASSRDTKTGYVLGAGFEHACDRNWSLKLEYQYIDLGDETVEGALFFRDGRPSEETFKTDFDADFHTVRVGLNYRFGDAEPAPLK